MGHPRVMLFISGIHSYRPDSLSRLHVPTLISFLLLYSIRSHIPRRAVFGVLVHEMLHRQQTCDVDKHLGVNTNPHLLDERYK